MFLRKSFPQILILFCFLYACSSPKQDSSTASETKGIVIPKGQLTELIQWSEDRIPLVSAHRGGPYPGYPENAIETFEYIASQIPTVIECDIAMTKDSVLIMMHDNTLDRTTNGSGRVLEVDYEYVQSLNLVDNEGQITAYKVPTLNDVLQWARGKAVLTLDVKRGVPFERVVEAVQEMEARDYSIIITYGARDAALVYSLDPSLKLSVSLGSQEAYEAHRAAGIPDEQMVAFVGVSEPSPEWFDFLHRKGITCILGVLGNLDRKAIAQGDSTYLGYIQRGADILATDRPLEAAKAIELAVPETSTKAKFFYGY
ncbi:glycerophosphodiester phosphodiesterase family protein [Roseivirga thermotolerans]|uniref:glycerophosphodiester phosphodiesterase family protein n=1 Tax=Roseivirga thermotolerans TaxID=1758176 RepID=UPI00273FD773|nr:glycerophosphodiester phosphodiesterase family protein [Roseivirga thermotolerans]